ncbi:hypothetical protein G9A89_008771 [Geosiphon pyriformis]|nr:hypothetical protein G9A89_008771 [Geosiphon pyriformis]
MIQLALRNSLAKREIKIRGKIINVRYVENIIAILQNNSEKEYIIEPNEKIAQAIFLPLVKIAQLVLVKKREELRITAKGINGFESMSKIDVPVNMIEEEIVNKEEIIFTYPEIKVEHSIEDSLPGGIPVIKLRKKLTKLQFRKAMNKTITIESLIILQKTSTNTNLKVAKSENIGANHLEFAKFLFQYYCQHLGLNHNHISKELAFNFYINEKITYLLGTPVNIKLAREVFYSELIQNTNLPTNHNFTFIIMKINKKIEHHTQQRYPITYMSKGKRKLQTPAVTPKKIQPLTWKKTRVESPTNPSYHYTPGSTINITFTSAATSNMTSAFG